MSKTSIKYFVEKAKCAAPTYFCLTHHSGFCSYGTCTAVGCKSDADCTDPTKPVCDTATNICKIACHYENLVGSGDYMETCVSPSGTLADVCSGSTRKMAVCDWAANSCYYSDFSACSGSTPACAVNADGRSVCVECISNADCGPSGLNPTTCESRGYPNRYAKCDTATYTCSICGLCETNLDCKNNFCCDRDPALPISDRGTGQCFPTSSGASPVYNQKYLCTT